MKNLVLYVAVILCFFAQPSFVNAQENDEVLFYTYGEVLSVGENQILIREFDYGTGEEKDVVYHITPDTIFDEVESADQITPTDLVDVEFIATEDGRNIAKEILVDRIEDYEYEEVDIEEDIVVE
jgi:hypothetical protein